MSVYLDDHYDNDTPDEAPIPEACQRCGGSFDDKSTGYWGFATTRDGQWLCESCEIKLADEGFQRAMAALEAGTASVSWFPEGGGFW